MINLENIIGLVGTEEKALYYEKLAIGFINSFLGYNIEETEYIFEADYLSQEIYLPNYPITEIIKIEQNNGTVFDPDFSEVPSSDYRTIGTAGKLISKYQINKPVRITYKAGYKPYEEAQDGTIINDVPKELETAITVLIAYYYKNDTGQNDLKSETVDGDKIEYNLPSTKLEQIEILLSKFQHYDLSA